MLMSNDLLEKTRIEKWKAGERHVDRYLTRCLWTMDGSELGSILGS